MLNLRRNSGFNFLTLLVGSWLVSSIIAVNTHGAIFDKKIFKTHLRWSFNTPKDQLLISKIDNKVKLETLNIELYQDLIKNLTQKQIDIKYIKDISHSQVGYPEQPAKIEIILTDDSVELFSFYKENEKRYVLDFWINQDIARKKQQALSLARPPAAKKKAQVPFSKKDKTKVPVNALTKKTAIKVNTDQNYRDFRYGGSYLWNYQPMFPVLEQDINISRKTPDFFYEIQDRDIKNDEKEAHMQLTINFYRDQKWGLMNKSIRLYQEKYQQDQNEDLNNFLKANALFKENIKEKNKGIFSAAINILKNISDQTGDYQLLKSCMRYLIQYNIDQNNYVETLKLAQRLFIKAKVENDNKMIGHAGKIALHSLAKLNQVQKIGDLAKDEKLTELLSKQLVYAYTVYTKMQQGKELDVIRLFEENRQGLVSPIEPSLLYNVAEAYFRQSKYQEAIKIFDQFIVGYSYLKEAAAARLRIALSYEISGKNMAEVIALYRSAIDRSADPATRLEAKIRYVSLRLNRKIQIDDSDKESVAFLNIASDEEKILNDDLKTLLWLVRLRSYINMQEYQTALNYLDSIPLKTMRPSVARVFQGDGAEVVYGLVQKQYFKKEYSEVVKSWELHKDRYEQKVAFNPYINFLICDSYINLGLFQSFERSLQDLQKLKDERLRTFPIWVKRTKDLKIAEIIKELEIIKAIAQKNWQSAKEQLLGLDNDLKKKLNYDYYQAVVAMNLNDLTNAQKHIENVLIYQNLENPLDPRQKADILLGLMNILNQTNQQQRLSTTAKAIIKDLQETSEPVMLNVRERARYLLIENINSDKNGNRQELGNEIAQFISDYPKSSYIHRVRYLMAVNFIDLGKIAEATEIFNTLLNDTEVPGFLKELTKTELSGLKLRTNTNL